MGRRLLSHFPLLLRVLSAACCCRCRCSLRLLLLLLLLLSLLLLLLMLQLLLLGCCMPATDAVVLSLVCQAWRRLL